MENGNAKWCVVQKSHKVNENILPITYKTSMKYIHNVNHSSTWLYIIMQTYSSQYHKSHLIEIYILKTCYADLITLHEQEI